MRVLVVQAAAAVVVVGSRPRVRRDPLAGTEPVL